MPAKERPGLLTLTRPRAALLVVAGLVVAALLVAAGGTDDGEPITAGERTSRSASGILDIELSTFDGSPVRLGDLAGGTPLVVNFFASWCGPCVREMPDLEAVHRRHDDEVAFVGVNLQDTPEAAADLVAETGVTYPVVRDDAGALFRAVNAFSMPTTVFLDADGNVVELHGGGLSQGALEDRIARLVRS